jgi:hypothetical protein
MADLKECDGCGAQQMAEQENIHFSKRFEQISVKLPRKADKLYDLCPACLERFRIGLPENWKKG